MNLTILKKALKKIKKGAHLPTYRNGKGLLSWIDTWEIYPILLIAGFLRLYQLHTSEFDADQAAIFGMAHAAVRYGMLPLMSIRASIGIEHPPAAIYFYMLPASLSANPLWAVVLVGLLNTLAVLLTYVFTRRYYGRLAAVIAALLYATAAEPLTYSRFIWQPNMIAPLTMLFLFAIFRGVVERRKGWLFPALLLLGIIYQLHETSTLLIIPLVVAIVLAPGTVRWRDLAFTFIALLIIFSPYLLWEYSTHFADVNILLTMAKRPAHIDNAALTLYESFISPYTYSTYMQVQNNSASLLHFFAPIFYVLRHTLLLLVLGGLAVAGLVALLPSRIPVKGIRVDSNASDTSGIDRIPVKGIPTMDDGRIHASPVAQFHGWWTQFRNTPYRCGLLLLCVWQVVPVLLLSRHSVSLYPYYLLMLIPGPFILGGIFISQVVKWTHLLRQVALPATMQSQRNIPMLRVRKDTLLQVLRYSMYAVAAFAIIAQLATSTASLLDSVQGNNRHGKTWNDLGSLQHALAKADQLAQARHLNRVYITTDTYTQTAFGYLAEQMHTPTTLFDDSHCLPLPGVQDGPAVLLVSPYAQVTQSLLNGFATTTLVDQPARLGTPPFKLYIIAPATKPISPATNTFGNDLQLLSAQTQRLPNNNNPLWMVLHWNVQRTALPALRTSYNYSVKAQPNKGSGSTLQAQCSFSTLRANDQLLMAFPLPNNSLAPSFITVGVQANMTTPYNPMFGSIHGETDIANNTPQTTLQTSTGDSTITISPRF